MNEFLKTILPIIFAEILKCLDKGTPEGEVTQNLRRPHFGVAARAERQYRQEQGIGPLAWRRQRAAVVGDTYEQLAKLSDEDALAIIDEARDYGVELKQVAPATQAGAPAQQNVA